MKLKVLPLTDDDLEFVKRTLGVSELTREEEDCLRTSPFVERVLLSLKQEPELPVRARA